MGIPRGQLRKTLLIRQLACPVDQLHELTHVFIPGYQFADADRFMVNICQRAFLGPVVFLTESYFTRSTSTSSPFERMLTVSVPAVLSVKLKITDELPVSGSEGCQPSLASSTR
jgi:hypothetical protein